MVQPNGQPLDNTGNNANGPQNPGAAPNQPGAAPGGGNVPGAIVPSGQAIGPNSFGSPSNPALPAQQLNSAVNNAPLASNIASSNQGTVQRLLISPAEQSEQIAEMERRYQQNKTPLTNDQANDFYNRELAAQEQAKQNAQQNQVAGGAQPAQPGAQPGGAAAQANTGTPGAGALPVPDYARANQDILKKANAPLNPVVKGPLNETGQGYVITSLATGIKAKGLAGFMKTAEDQMRAGKFTDALNSYDNAQQVAPNNPLIPLGRSFAELGASYYGKAETDLRNAVRSDAAVLMPQYDLKGFIGEDRLKFVVKDLKDVANTEKTERPVLLLAYISHNVGDDEGAAKYLNDADTRSGGRDQMVELMRTVWHLAKPEAK
jgi:hypothetical protein